MHSNHYKEEILFLIVTSKQRDIFSRIFAIQICCKNNLILKTNTKTVLKTNNNQSQSLLLSINIYNFIYKKVRAFRNKQYSVIFLLITENGTVGKSSRNALGSESGY